jgi:hypothetical protein
MTENKFPDKPEDKFNLKRRLEFKVLKGEFGLDNI